MVKSVPAAESSTQTSEPSVARVAGRGTVFITLAKIWFMISGYGIHFVLARLLGPEQYGIYQVVTGIVSIINAVVVTGTYQTVSKHISPEPFKAGSIKAKSLRLQALIGGGIALGFFLLAPVVARLLNDVRLTPFLRIAALITLSYSFYAVYTGYFNGLKRFLAQATLDITYSTFKLTFVVLFVWLGFGVAGGVGGFVLAAASVLAVSAIAGRGGEKNGTVGTRELLAFQANLIFFTLVFNLLQKVDLILIKSMSSPVAEIASTNAGYYGAAINLANLTYQIIISVTFVIFPLISASTFESDQEKTRSYISNTLRYSLMIMALVSTLFAANANEVISVVYKSEFLAASPALSVVSYGMLLFGALYVVTTVISASGRPSVSLRLGLLSLVVSIVLNALLIPSYGIVGAAIGTSVAMFAGVTAGVVYLVRRFGPIVPMASVFRIGLCAGVVAVLSLLYSSQSRLMTVAQLGVLSLVYIAGLLFSRELSRDDLKAARHVISTQ